MKYLSFPEWLISVSLMPLRFIWFSNQSLGHSRWLSGQDPSANAGDAGLIPGLGSSPGEGNGNPLQYSCWEIP